MSELQEEINSIIKDAIEENDGEDKVSQLNFSEKELDIVELTVAMKEAIEKCPNVDFLGLSQCKLTSLENFPNLPKLDTIDLKDNALTDDEVLKIKDAKNLKNLYLENNKVKNVETFEQLAKNSPLLEVLEISSNPVDQVAGFEARLWKAFPNLEVLNQHDRSGNKLEDIGDEEEDDQGQAGDSEEDEYEEAEESEQDSEFSQGDYDSENEKPKKKRKTK